MLTQQYNREVAKLANDQICTWRGHDKPIAPSTHEHQFAIAVVCPGTDILVGLTHGKRILAGKPHKEVLVDITSSICDALGIDTNCVIEEIHTNEDNIIIRAGRCVGNMQICRKSTNRWIQADFTLDNVAVYKFEHDVDLISFDEGHGFIRTVDGGLFSTGSNSSCEGAVPFDRDYGTDLRKVDISYAQDIREIICGNRFTILFMIDGSIRACGLGHGNLKKGYAGTPFALVEFSDGVRIARVITDGYLIFYVTTKGLCYVTLSRTQGLSPELVHMLDGYSIENVFILKRIIIIQHDEGKLAWIYDLNKEPIPLPFFDDKSIVSVNWMGEHIYFITIEGYVYYSGLDLNQDQIVMIPFFTNNPIMVERSITHIRSATNKPRRTA